MNRTGAHSRFAFALVVLATLGAASSCAPDSGIPSEDTPSLGTRVEEPLRVAPEREWFLRELGADVEVPDDGFGLAVGISAITAVVAAPATLPTAQGGPAVYVFVRSEDGWHQQAKLEPPLDFADRFFGSSIAISGDTLIVGAMPTGAVPGAAYVFVRSGTTWSAPVPLLADDGAPDHRFGSSVAIDGNTAVVGAPYATGGGAAYVFSRSGSNFTQTSRLFGSTASLFGQSVAISGTTILVAAPEARMSRGQAHIFTPSGSVWSEQILSIPDLYFQLGSSVALDGNVALVGSSAHPGFNAAVRMGERQGAAYVFAKSTSEWTQVLTLFANDGEDFDVFGTSVAVSGGTVMAGAPGDAQGVPIEDPANSVYVFDVLQGPALEARIGSRGAVATFGASLALDGDIAIVGTRSGQRGAHVAELLVPNGDSCAENLDCQERHCVSGVCCDTACTGACESCDFGTCSPEPHAPGTPTCEPYLCSEASGDCPMSCAVHADCVATFYCLGSQCVEREPNGETCTVARVCASGRCIDGECAGTLDIGARCSSAAECDSNHCEDGYCCDRRCDGQCEACGERAAPGICTAVTGAPRGERAACVGYGTVCGSECDGEHSARCTYPTNEPCGSSCSNGRQTDSTCNGRGACAGVSFSCDGLACADDSVCKTRCEGTDDCVTGYTCQDGKCEQSAVCLNEHTSERTDGSEDDCTPYLCEEEEGSCRDSCDDPRDCTDGYVCNPDHQCATPPPRSGATTNDAGCGCRAERPRPSDVPWALWAFFVVLARATRRRSFALPPDRPRRREREHGRKPGAHSR